MKRGVVTAALVVTLVLVSLVVPARGQGWSVEVSTGRLVYEPIATDVATSNIMGSLRYEFFPHAERKRPRKPGGWVVGPEIGWRGYTPAGKGRPMSNTILLGIWFGYYWGR